MRAVIDIDSHFEPGSDWLKPYPRLAERLPKLDASLLAVDAIEKEAARASAGEPALVQIKVNALVDEDVADALYRAAQAGVRVDLLIRGMCTLRPGVPGLSETIRVRSVI